EARAHAEVSLTMLADTTLQDLERFPTEELPSEQMVDVRKLLCVSIGKIHAFLQDTFGQIMASDPRSQHDADYFLSKRFPQDVEEAEWLHSTVEKLRDYLEELDGVRAERFSTALSMLRTEQAIPTERSWVDCRNLLSVILSELVPKLREVLALRGIRFHEMEILDRYASDLPVQCTVLEHLFETARETIAQIKSTAGESRAEREQSVRDLVHCHTVFSARMSSLLADIDQSLRDLLAFVPLWLDGIEMRRALLLRRNTGGESGARKNAADAA
ncbi:MAG: hypothetical protein MI919_41120, partial [Holophagales bacterium]|nr:hypothetical protein [Holophagales bacterium]